MKFDRPQPSDRDIPAAGWEKTSEWTFRKGRWAITHDVGGLGYDLWEDGYPNDGESYRDGSRYYGHFDRPEDAMRAQQREAAATLVGGILDNLAPFDTGLEPCGASASFSNRDQTVMVICGHPKGHPGYHVGTVSWQ